VQQRTQLFDHFVGAQKRCGRHVEAKHLGRLEIDDEFEFSGLAPLSISDEVIE
jgi:hypothetical protein